MTIYMIIEISIKNENLYSQYIDQVPKIVEKYGGKYLVRGGKVTSISSNWNPERIIVVEFDTIDQLQKCFKSPEYLELAPLREKSTISKAIAVEGCAID